MIKYFLTGTAAALLLTSAAVGAPAATTGSGHAAITQTDHNTKSKTHHRHHNHLAKKASIRGDNEVHALNVLEAAGYRQLNNLHAQGLDFVAKAEKAGKSYNVSVTPTGSIKATIV